MGKNVQAFDRSPQRMSWGELVLVTAILLAVLYAVMTIRINAQMESRPSAATAAATVTVVVAEGDSLWALEDRHGGLAGVDDRREWVWAVGRLNWPTETTHGLQPGESVDLPDWRGLSRRQIAAQVAAIRDRPPVVVAEKAAP